MRVLLPGPIVGSMKKLNATPPRSHSLYVDSRAVEGIVNDDIGWTIDMVLLPHDHPPNGGPGRCINTGLSV
jgi:hypothetical protein